MIRSHAQHLPRFQDDLVRNSAEWHKESSTAPRPEDVIVAAFVQLRRLSAETSDVFYLKKNSPRGASDIHFQSLLRVSNTNLSDWMEYWEAEMKKGRFWCVSPVCVLTLYPSSEWERIPPLSPSFLPSPCQIVPEQSWVDQSTHLSDCFRLILTNHIILLGSAKWQ
jgi:hypothetical protein